LFPSQERCGHHGLTLIEGACHAIDSTVDGRPIGSFGTAGAFSLSKHAGAGVGGFLAIEHARDLPALERLRDQVTVDRNFGASLGIAGHPGPARAPRARQRAAASAPPVALLGRRDLEIVAVGFDHEPSSFAHLSGIALEPGGPAEPRPTVGHVPEHVASDVAGGASPTRLPLAAWSDRRGR